jgi:magnesium transporter
MLSLGAALLAVAIIQYYLDIISHQLWLAVLIPVVAAMGSTAATQTMTVVVRGIGLGEVSRETSRRVVVKETLAGLINGLVVGAVSFSVISVWFGWQIAGVLGITMVLSLFAAGLLGALIPVALKLLRADPAPASSVFVVTLTNVTTFFFYLGVATLLLKYLNR